MLSWHFNSRSFTASVVAIREKEAEAIYLAGLLRTVLLYGRVSDAVAHHVAVASRRLGDLATDRLAAAGCADALFDLLGTLFYSLCCSGFGFHTGWLPWWYWVQQKPIPRRPSSRAVLFQ